MLMPTTAATAIAPGRSLSASFVALSCGPCVVVAPVPDGLAGFDALPPAGSPVVGVGAADVDD
jgi:hypothetical protein